MGFAGKAKRVRIYLRESDSRGLQRAHFAVLTWLAREGALGATVFHGLAGLGASGRIAVDLKPEVEPPIVVEWIDSPDAVERLLPRLKELIGERLVTVEEIEIAAWKAPAVRDLSARTVCAEVMSREVVSVSPETPLRELVELIEGKVYRAVPVVEDGRPVGIVTNRDLVERGGLAARIELLASLAPADRSAALAALDREGRTARQVMTGDPLVVAETAPLREAADLMTRKRFKRLPVVDAQGKLAGMVSRLDLLRTVARGFGGGSAGQRAGLSVDQPLARVMRRDVPAVAPDTGVGEVLQAVVATDLHHAFVVDSRRRVVGIVGEEQLLVRVTPAARPSALKALMNRLPFSHASSAELEHDKQTRARSAADLMRTDVAIAHEDQLVRDAIRPMVEAVQRVVAVVDAEGRLTGALDRADVLRGLVLDSA
jgi:CBS domain-containing protein